MYKISSRGTITVMPRSIVSQSLGGKSRVKERTVMDDDALRHAAEHRICRHLRGTQMTRWEAERARFCGTVS